MRKPNWYDYDSALQMIREPHLAQLDIKKLQELRWYVVNRQHKHLDGWVMGPPSGPIVFPPAE
jgi:hypothetical protein